MTHKNIKSSLRTFSFLEPLKSSYFFFDNLSLDVLIKGVLIKKKECIGYLKANQNDQSFPGTHPRTDPRTDPPTKSRMEAGTLPKKD